MLPFVYCLAGEGSGSQLVGGGGFFLMCVNILLTRVSGALGSLKGALDPLGLE